VDRRAVITTITIMSRLGNAVTNDEVASSEAGIRGFVERNPEFLETSLITKDRGAETILRSDATTTSVDFYAVVRPQNGPQDIVALETVPLEALYPKSSAKPLLWARAIDSLYTKAEDVIKHPTTDINFEAKVTVLFGQALALKEYLGLSSGHNQVISTFYALVINEGRREFSLEKLKGFLSALRTLRNRVRINDETVDRFIDILDEHALDHSMPMCSEVDESAADLPR
jgi:hypothetical protein